MTFGVTGNWSHALVTSACCHEIFVAVVSNFNTVFTFLTRTPLIAVETAMHIYFSFIYLLGFETAFLPSKYQTGGVPRIPSVVSDPWKRKSRPKKNEYFEYLSKATAKKKNLFKIFSKQEKNILRSSP